MADFERQLMGGIPLHEAAEFFIRVKQPSDAHIKEASVKMAGAAADLMNELAAGGPMPAGKAGRFKKVDQIKEAVAGAMSKKDKMKKAAALLKIAFGEEQSMGGEAMGGGPNMQGGQPTPAAQGAPGTPSPEAMGSPPVQDPAAAVPSSPPTLPVNYMEAEQMAQAAQEANEVGFLRERLNAATEQNNAMQAQLGDVQAQLDQMNQQSQQTGEQVMAATAEAVNASERALQQNMQAANMRIGINKMRESFLQLASQDPEQLGTLAQQEQVQAQQMEQAAVDSQAGTPEQSASPETGTGAPPAGAPEPGGPGPESGGSDSQPGKQPNISIKTGSVPWAVPGAVAGAGLAALHSRKMGQGTDELEQEVQGLEQEQDQGSFGKAMELAKAKMRLAESELHQKHPTRAGMQSTLGGAFGGAMVGSALQGLASTAKHMA